MKIIMFFIILLMIGALFIVSNKNLALKNSENIPLFMSYYSSWIRQLFSNGVGATGFVVKMEWLPNSTR